MRKLPFIFCILTNIILFFAACENGVILPVDDEWRLPDDVTQSNPIQEYETQHINVTYDNGNTELDFNVDVIELAYGLDSDNISGIVSTIPASISYDANFDGSQYNFFVSTHCIFIRIGYQYFNQWGVHSITFYTAPDDGQRIAYHEVEEIVLFDSYEEMTAYIEGD